MINNVIDSTITKVLVSRDDAANVRAVYEIADGTVITSKKKLKPGKSTTTFSELENQNGALITADDVTGAVTTNSGFQVIAEQDDGFVKSNYQFKGKRGSGSAIPKGRPKEISNIKQFERNNDLDINEDGLFAGKDPITGKPPKPEMPGGKGGNKGDDIKGGDQASGSRGGGRGNDTGVPLTPTPSPGPEPSPSPAPAPSPAPGPAPSPSPGRGGGPRRRLVQPEPEHIERRWISGQQKSDFDPFNDNNNPFLLANDLFSSHSDLN